MPGSLVERAFAFVDHAHTNQKRKHTGLPYIYHPVRVAGYVAAHFFNEQYTAVALLHDVLEDCEEVRLNDLAQFGELVQIMVRQLTNRSKEFPKLKRAERKQLDREHLASCPAEVKIIKMYDRLDNLIELALSPPETRSFVELYHAESLALLDVIGGACQPLAERIRQVIELRNQQLGHADLMRDAPTGW